MDDLQLPNAPARLSGLTYACTFAGAALFLYLRTFVWRGIPFQVFGDQHQFFARGLRVANGQVPFRDFFTFITPGTEYLYAAGFRIFGVHAWVIAGWAVVVGLAYCWLLTWIAAQILPLRLQLLPALLFLSLDFLGSADMTHHWFSTLAALGAVAVLMPGITVARTAASGGLCAATTLFTQTSGLAAFVAVVIFIGWQAYAARGYDRRPTLTSLAAGCAAYVSVLAISLGLFIRAAGFSQVFYQLVVFAPRYFSFEGRNHPGEYLHQFPGVHGPADLLRFLPFVMVYLLVPYVYGFGIFRIVRTRAALPLLERRNLVLLNILGIMLFVSVLHSARYFRLATIEAPAILVFVWLLSAPGRIGAISRNTVRCVALAFMVVLVIHRQRQRYTVVDLPAGRTAFTDGPMAQEFRWFAVHSHPGDSLFNNSSLTLYLWLHNPTGIEFITHREFTRPEWVDRSLVAMRHDPPDFICLDSDPVTDSQRGDHAAPIRQFAQQNYTRVATFSLNQGTPYEEVVMERNDRITASQR